MKYLINILVIITLLNITLIPSYAISDISVIVRPQAIQFHIEDSNGKITGYTPNGILKQIPNIGNYRESGTPDADIDSTEYDEWHQIDGDGSPITILPGQYKLVLYATSMMKIPRASVEIWGSSTREYILFIDDIAIFPNTIAVYEFTIPTMLPTNSEGIVTIKVSNPQDLIKDINAAGQSNYIGNAKFISELVKDINEIEAEKAKGKIDDGLTPAQKAKKEYTELMKEITEKYNKPETDEFVKQEAYNVLREDIDYIINHIQ